MIVKWKKEELCVKRLIGDENTEYGRRSSSEYIKENEEYRGKSYGI